MIKDELIHSFYVSVVCLCSILEIYFQVSFWEIREKRVREGLNEGRVKLDERTGE